MRKKKMEIRFVDKPLNKHYLWKKPPALVHFDEGLRRRYEEHYGNFRELFEKNMSKVGKINTFSSDIGIEIEAENIIAVPIHDQYSWFGWKRVEDGSLKNHGAEFVSVPLKTHMVQPCLTMLWTLFDLHQRKYPPVFDWRSSTHIHLDMTLRGTEHLFKIILLYSIFEDSLFDYAGVERKKSNFCVPLNNTNLNGVISDFVHEKISLETLRQKWTKYSALNIYPIKQLGTIEFRAMSGTYDVSKVAGWINLITSLDNFSQRTTVTDLIEHIRTLNTTSYYEVFKESVFGEYKYLLSSPDSCKKIREGILFAKQCLVPEGISGNIRSNVILTKDSSSFLMKMLEQSPSIKKKSSRNKMIDVDWGSIAQQYAQPVPVNFNPTIQDDIVSVSPNSNQP